MLAYLKNKISMSFIGALLSVPALCSAAWQMPPTDFGTGASIRLDSDANGHAIVLYSNLDNADMEASYYSNGAWSLSTILYGDLTDASALSMENSGTALALFHDQFNNGNLLTRYFDGSTWSTPLPDPLDVIPGASPSLSVDMNGPGSGVAVWINAGTVNSSFFSTGAWGTITPIGTGDFAVSVGYSANGDAAAGWFDFGVGVKAANYVAGSWSPQVILDPTGDSPTLAIDASGNAILAAVNTLGNIEVFYFNGVTWSVDQIIAPTAGNSSPSLAMAPGGTAILVWQDAADNGLYSTFNGTTWSSPLQFSTTPLNGSPLASPDVSVDNAGNALIIWGTTTPQIVSAKLPLNGVLGVQELVANTIGPSLRDISSSLSSDGTGFSAWESSLGGEFYDNFASVTIAVPPFVPPLPPASIDGATCRNAFATQMDRVNIITFTPSPSADVVTYIVRRDGVVVAVVSAAGPFVFYDHNRERNVEYVYSVTAVSAGGLESTPVFIVLP